MKKQLIFMLYVLFSMVGYAQHGAMVFGDEYASYEIRDERRIGAGTKYTEYYFNDIGKSHYKMRALVVEIDNDNQYTYQTPFMARYAENQTYHNATTKRYEFELQEGKGRKPLACIMGTAFAQNAPNALTIMMEVSGGLISDGIMFYMPANGDVHYYVDGNGKVSIGRLTCSPKVTAENAGTFSVSGYNRLRSNYPNGITVFANGYGVQGKYRTADIQEAKDLGTEVVVELDDPDTMISSGVFSGKVVAKMSGSLHVFSKGQFVLSALQGNADNYLKSLQVGEKITLDLQYYDAQNNPVALKSTVRQFFGYAVKDGVAQGSGMTQYAQDAMGVSADGKKSYFIHLDNNNYGNDVSNAPISIFNQFIQQIDGLYEAILVDGGPSAEMVVSGEWVSAERGRAIPTSMMTYSLAPSSTSVEEIDFTDHSRTFVVGDSYTPDFYFFNEYGDLVKSSETTAIQALKEMKLTCDEQLGEISADGMSFIPHNGGKGSLYCEYKGRRDQMYVEVLDLVGIRVEPKEITGEKGDVITAKLYKKLPDGTEEQIDNSLATWYTNNTHAVVSCDNGEIYLYMPGPAEVYAEYLGMTDVISVNVITSVEQIENTAPVKITVSGDILHIVAAGGTAVPISCVVYSADGKIMNSASATDGVLDISRSGTGSPAIIQLIVDGKLYTYKIM